MKVNLKPHHGIGWYCVAMLALAMSVSWIVALLGGGPDTKRLVRICVYAVIALVMVVIIARQAKKNEP